MASIVLSPVPERTIGGYYARLILLVLTGLGGDFFYYLMTYSTILWAPILMATRKRWYPMPGCGKTDTLGGSECGAG
ncbi:MAG: hypothetical protein M5R36_17880 [Deltaproteobacteria bacterium]|nr:hypothetical protein [Deltaproteobacteria bacterium]